MIGIVTALVGFLSGSDVAVGMVDEAASEDNDPLLGLGDIPQRPQIQPPAGFLFSIERRVSLLDELPGRCGRPAVERSSDLLSNLPVDVLGALSSAVPITGSRERTALLGPLCA